jgi:hypothetical protein
MQGLPQACTRRAKHVGIKKLNWKKRGTPAVKEAESEIVIEVSHEEWIFMFAKKQRQNVWCIVSTVKSGRMFHMSDTARKFLTVT